MVNLFVSRLDYSVTQEDLITLFKPHGFVKKVSIPMDKETGKPRGIAFIEINTDNAQAVIDALDGYSINNRAISVKIAEDRGSKPNFQDNRSERRPFNNSRPGSERGENRARFSRPNDRQEGASPQRDLNRPVRTENANRSDFDVPFSRQDADRPSSTSNDFSPKIERSPKKSKDKKSFSSGTNDGPKKGKMEAYKKSSKNNKFFDDDDDFDY